MTLLLLTLLAAPAEPLNCNPTALRTITHFTENLTVYTGARDEKCGFKGIRFRYASPTKKRIHMRCWTPEDFTKVMEEAQGKEPNFTPGEYVSTYEYTMPAPGNLIDVRLPVVEAMCSVIPLQPTLRFKVALHITFEK